MTQIEKETGTPRVVVTSLDVSAQLIKALATELLHAEQRAIAEYIETEAFYKTLDAAVIKEFAELDSDFRCHYDVENLEIAFFNTETEVQINVDLEALLSRELSDSLPPSTEAVEKILRGLDRMRKACQEHLNKEGKA